MAPPRLSVQGASRGRPASSASEVGLWGWGGTRDLPSGRTGDTSGLPAPHGTPGVRHAPSSRWWTSFTLRMADTKLSQAEAAQRQAYVLRKVGTFARQYRQDLLVRLPASSASRRER